MNQQILAEKKEIVSKINDVLKNAHSTIVVSYSGLSVAEVTKLRIALKKAGADMEVHKNTLLRKAVDEDGLQALDSLLKGPNALVTSHEEGASLQVLKDFAKTHKKFAIKGGMIDGTYCDENRLQELAAVGTKENAIATLLSVLQSPLTQFALTLKALAERDAPAEA